MSSSCYNLGYTVSSFEYGYPVVYAILSINEQYVQYLEITNRTVASNLSSREHFYSTNLTPIYPTIEVLKTVHPEYFI